MYDPDVNPGAVAWFKGTATRLLDRIPGCLALLAAHGVPCERLESADPGRVVYEDDVQLVVVPRPGILPRGRNSAPHPGANPQAAAAALDNSPTA